MDSLPLSHQGSPCYCFFNLFILAALGLRCCAQAVSSRSEPDLGSGCAVQTSHCLASPVLQDSLSGVWASAYAGRALSSWGSRPPEHRLSTVSAGTYLPPGMWRRKRQRTPVSLPGKSHGQRSLAGYRP